MKLVFELLDGWSKITGHCRECDKYLFDEKNVFEFLNNWLREFLNNWLCQNCAEELMAKSLEKVLK